MYADRAIYVSKFEAVDKNALQIASNTSNTEDVTYTNLNSTCLCESENTSSFCNDTELLTIVAGINVSEFMTKKLILLADAVFVVLVSTDFVSIYSYDIDVEQLDQVAGESRVEILFTATLCSNLKIVTLRDIMFDRIIRA